MDWTWEGAVGGERCVEVQLLLPTPEAALTAMRTRPGRSLGLPHPHEQL